MKLSARAILALCSAAAVVFLVWMDLRHTGPGAISAVHLQVAELRGGQACKLCHGLDADDLAAACLDCHAEITTQLEAHSGLHGKLGAGQQRSCGTCHQEHLGDEIALTAERSFRLAELPGPDDFDHRTSAFELHGKHGKLACVDCHPNADLELLPEGQLRFLGKTQTCVECHQDPHDGAMQRGCEGCHGQEHPFADLSQFPHAAKFPLHGSHSGLACADCHETMGNYSVAVLSGGADELAWRSCAQCHESPHQKDFLTTFAEVEGGNCALCHSEEHDAFHGPQVKISPAQHQASGFSLAAPHHQLQCEQCHGTAASGLSFAQRFPGRMAEQCRDCHQDPHDGQFDHVPFKQRDCLSCHDGDRFHPHDFGLEEHKATAFELTGSHQQTACEDCHLLPGESHGIAQQGPGGAARIFAGTFTQCEQCHSDAHAGAFLAVEQGMPVSIQGTCARCHDTSAFHLQNQEFDHALWTGFALESGHDLTDCEACHQRSELADASGRRFGRVADLHPGDPDACVGCHVDIHLGNFDRQGLPRQLAGRAGCARCHQVSAFHELQKGAFDHALWTNFALSGAHRFNDCESCHRSGQTLQPARRLGVVSDHYSGDLQRCVSCHPDPHGGQFERPGLADQVAGKAGCQRCHDQVSFRISSRQEFDHQLWTEFSLQGGHAQASCSSCHPVLAQADPHGRNFARAQGSACEACHVDPHVGQFAQAGRTECAQCHSGSGSDFKLPDFDHNQRTQFVLDASHAQLDCAQCHLNRPLLGGGTAVRYRPLGQECQDCHTVVPKASDQGDGR